MKNKFSVLLLSDLLNRRDASAEDIRDFSAGMEKFIYIRAENEIPDHRRIGQMFDLALSGADLIMPARHSAYPQDEFMEERQLQPVSWVFIHYRLAPLLNGALIRKKVLLKALEENKCDWIHSPCPDLFFLLLHPMKTAAVRTGFRYDPDHFRRYCQDYRKVFSQLERMPLTDEDRTHFRSLILQYGEHLIDRAVDLDFPRTEIFDLFGRLSGIHCFFSRHQEKLLGMTLPKTDFCPGPVLRLGVFCGVLRNGGAERCASLLLQFFSNRPNLKIYLFQNSERAAGDYPCPENVEIIVLPKDFYARYACLPALLKEKKIDTCLFFDHFMELFYYDILAAKELGIRTIAMEHNTFSFPLHSGDIELLQLRETVYSGTDIVTCLSTSDEYLWNSRGICARYMPNPLTFDTSDRPPFKGRTARTLILIARLIPDKGVLDAVKTVEIVREKHPDVKLFLLGVFPDPSFEREVDDYIRMHDLTDNIVFTGFTAEVEKYIAQSSIHLMPSRVEGYPMTLMEAKSWGVPTVAYSLPYLEAGKEEYGTIMVPQGDYGAMAGEVIRLLDDFEELNKLAGKAYDSLKYFDNQMVLSRWNALFQWLETGTEPEELKLPPATAGRKLEFHRIQLHEIVNGLDHLRFSQTVRKKIYNTILARKRTDDIFLSLCLRIYFALREKMSGSTPIVPKVFFSILWQLKKCYRVFRPFQEDE